MHALRHLGGEFFKGGFDVRRPENGTVTLSYGSIYLLDDVSAIVKTFRRMPPHTHNIYIYIYVRMAAGSHRRADEHDEPYPSSIEVD